MLECTVTGPVLAAERDCSIAVTGGNFTLRLNGLETPLWTSIRLAGGDRLDLGERASGGRCYVAVGGGFAGERWLGSTSTYLLVGRGGFQCHTGHDTIMIFHGASVNTRIVNGFRLRP